MRFLLTFSRILAGLVFMFSGFVKAVDPMGSTYKFMDYFEVFSVSWLGVFALPFAILLSSLEFTIGAALVLRVKMPQASWALLLFMSFFTVLTLYIAVFNPVADCGCFGDALVISNWETFYKNVVLMAFTLIVFLNRRRFKQRLSEGAHRLTALLVFIAISGISIHAYLHLPVLDFLPYKKGVSLNAKPSKVEAFLIYTNKETGEKKEWLSEDLPWDDTLWAATWEYHDRRVVEYKEPGVVELPMLDEYGHDVSSGIFSEEGYLLVAVIHSAPKASKKAMKKLAVMYDQAAESGVHMIGACGSTAEDIDLMRHEFQLLFPVYQADDITLKMVVRANPGLLLLHNGVILKKWHYNDFPDFARIKRKYIK